MDWQDISTAPKDGTKIIGLYDDPSVPVVAIVWIDTASGEWRCQDFSYIGPINEPSHWRRFLPPPKEPANE